MLYTIHINIVIFTFISVVRNENNFTELIYKEYGFHNTPSQQLVLSPGNITTLSHNILDGRRFAQSSACSGSQCSPRHSDSTCYSPVPSGNNSNLSVSEFAEACPQILYSLSQDCVKISPSTEEHEEVEVKEKPSPLEVWGYGFLFVTLINICSLTGFIVLPFIKKDFYSYLLMFLIALAVGSLVASALLVLIPEAFSIHMDGYLWKACAIIGGIYLFFVTERFLKMITEYCMHKRNEESDVARVDRVASLPGDTYIDINRTGVELKHAEQKIDQMEEPSDALLQIKTGDGNTMDDTPCKGNGHVQSTDKIVTHKPKKPVATVAWMIIVGDAFHNFIDGLSIGAAFSESILLGISICLAVFCEELPHELGDFAILLNAGMSKKRALLFNFLSACTCYIGLAFGISLSSVAYATPWILAIAGGMFLYIALADMMPEMNHAAEEHKDKPFRVFFVQSCGFLTGVGAILLVSYYGGEIKL